MAHHLKSMAPKLQNGFGTKRLLATLLMMVIFGGKEPMRVTYSHTYGSNDPFVEERSYDQSWLGAISEDLDKICLFRVGAQQIDLKWLQERGRQEMLDNPGGLCEGLCTIK